MQRLCAWLSTACLVLLMSGCGGDGGGGTTYTIGGAVTGLSGSVGVVLQNNAGNNLTVKANGPFAFSTAIGAGSAYSVTVLNQPTVPAQFCAVTSGSGTVAQANVVNVVVTCAPYRGRFAYVANSGANSVSTYAIDSITGRLTFIGKAPAGSNPYSVTVDLSGHYAYVANTGDNSVSQYTIGAGGALSPMIPPKVSAGASPHAVTVDPAGQYAYVANNGDGTVSQYTIGPGGAFRR